MSTPAANAETGTEQGQEAPQGPDFSPVMDRLEQMDARFGAVEEWVQGQQQAPQGEPEESYEDFISRLFAGEEPSQQQVQEQQAQLPTPLQDPAVFQQLLDRHFDARYSKEIAPELQELRQDRFERQVGDLLSEFPALEDKETAEKVTAASAQLAEEIGQPDLWNNPRLVRAALLMLRGQERSDAEVPADASGGEARLEGGGGNPGGEEPGLAQQIIGAHRGQAPGDFRWF